MTSDKDARILAQAFWAAIRQGNLDVAKKILRFLNEEEVIIAAVDGGISIALDSMTKPLSGDDATRLQILIDRIGDKYGCDTL